MSKIRSAYRTYTASVIKSRSEVPDQTDMTVNGSDVECNNLTTTKTKNALGAATNKIGELSAHANINHWSCFGPTVRSTYGSGYGKVLVNSDPVANFKKGDFAGYNHGAVTPGWQSGGQAAAEANNWVNSGSQATCNANIDIGEIDWEGEMGAIGVAMLIFDVTDNIVGWGYTALSGIGSNFILSGTTTISGGIVLDKLDWYAMAFIVDQEITDPEDVISAMICRVPNISTWEINLKVKVATDITVEASGWTVDTPAFNLSAGTCGFNDAYKNVNLSNLRIVAQLFDWNWSQVGSDVELFNDVYYANDQLGVLSGKPDGNPIDAYGYHFKILFYETT
jgi:hypothetical protein